MKVPQVRSEDNWCAIFYKWVTVPETSQNNGIWVLRYKLNNMPISSTKDNPLTGKCSKDNERTEKD